MSSLIDKVKEIPIANVFCAFFPGVELKRDGRNLTALCPFHSEKTPSFKINVEKNRWKCFGSADCGGGSAIDLLLKAGGASSPIEAAKMIAEKFGIEVKEQKAGRPKPPTLSEYAAYVNLLPDFLTKTFHLQETAKGITLPYRDEAGNQVGVQIRHRLHKGKSKDARFSWKEGKPYLYGAWAMPQWKEKETRRVLLCEGASDVQVCWFNQVPALGIPGASTFRSEWASLLLPFTLIATIQEPGEAGEKLVKSICDALKGASYQGQVKAVSLSEKDPRDLWLKCGERFKDELQAAITKAPVIDLYPAIPLTKDLILKMVDLLGRHVFFKDQRLPLLIATWVLGTYVHDIFTFFGYVWINSPVKRCGKSLLEDILSQLCHKATPRLSNMSEASIFRLADKGHTLIIDELENLRREDKEKYGMVISILNSGFQQGGKVPRTEKREGGFEVVYFNAFCPKVLAGISRLADTVEDRAFKIPMIRKTKQERVERFNLRKQGKALKQLQAEIELWAQDRRAHIEAVYDSIEEIPELAPLDDRLKDISEPLVAIASYADAEALNGQQRVVPKLISLLLDMFGKRQENEKREAIGAFIQVAEEVLGGQEKVFIESAQLLERVKGIEELSWLESTKGLSAFLGKFDLHPKPKSGGKARGYWITREWLEEIKSRYSILIPDSEPSQVSQVHAQSAPEALF